MNLASEHAEAIYREVLSHVRADLLLREHVRRVGDVLFVQDAAYDLSAYRRVLVTGAGKAAPMMAMALGDMLGDSLSGGIVIGKEGQPLPVPGLRLVYGGHPVPNAASLAAGEEMVEFASQAGPDDLVLFCLSGGASAVMEALLPGISLADLQVVNQSLLASGAPIQVVNQVRARLSRLKAGGLARLFGRATVVCLVLSDVLGNDLNAIGSGPFHPDSRRIRAGRSGEVEKIVRSLAAKLPKTIGDHLLDSPELHTGPPVHHAVIGSAALLPIFAAQAARDRGLNPVPIGDPLQGEASLMAKKITDYGGKLWPKIEGPACLIFAGETTVTLAEPGAGGVGGRCGEMAVAAGMEIAGVPGVAFLAGCTDGGDGPTENAGGLVEGDSVSRSSMSALKALQANDTHTWLQAAGGLLKTGPTWSNVNDLCLYIRADEGSG